MANSNKAIQNASRLRYIRALERFHKSMLSYLNNTTQLSREGFAKKIDNSLKLLQRVEEVVLYKGELQDLQIFIKKIISYKDSDKDMQDVKDEILYSSNQLDKNKNARRYKKDKHTNSKFDEWL